MEFPDDWYEDIDGRSRMLNQEKVAAEIERLQRVEHMARCVLETFRKDEAQGYRSRDRQFAIELLGKFIVDEQSTIFGGNNA